MRYLFSCIIVLTGMIVIGYYYQEQEVPAVEQKAQLSAGDEATVVQSDEYGGPIRRFFKNIRRHRKK